MCEFFEKPYECHCKPDNESGPEKRDNSENIQRCGREEHVEQDIEQPQNKHVDEYPGQSQRKNAERKRKELEKRPNKGVEDSEDGSRDKQKIPRSLKFHPGHDQKRKP